MKVLNCKQKNLSKSILMAKDVISVICEDINIEKSDITRRIIKRELSKYFKKANLQVKKSDLNAITSTLFLIAKSSFISKNLKGKISEILSKITYESVVNLLKQAIFLSGWTQFFKDYDFTKSYSPEYNHFLQKTPNFAQKVYLINESLII